MNATEWTERHHFHLNGIEKPYLKQQKSDKAGSSLQKSKVLTNTTRQQNQTNVCLP